jgi:hypothetical protein
MPNSIKNPNTEKSQIEFYQKPVDGRSPTSKAQFEKPKLKNTKLQ